MQEKANVCYHLHAAAVITHISPEFICKNMSCVNFFFNAHFSLCTRKNNMFLPSSLCLTWNKEIISFCLHCFSTISHSISRLCRKHPYLYFNLTFFKNILTQTMETLYWKRNICMFCSFQIENQQLQISSADLRGFLNCNAGALKEHFFIWKLC